MVLSVRQVADRLNVKRSCVYALLRARKMRFVRLGRRRGTIRIREEALEQFIQDNTVPRRRKTFGKPRVSASSGFRYLNAARLLDAWAKQGVLPPVPRPGPCDPSVLPGEDRPA